MQMQVLGEWNQLRTEQSIPPGALPRMCQSMSDHHLWLWSWQRRQCWEWQEECHRQRQHPRIICGEGGAYMWLWLPHIKRGTHIPDCLRKRWEPLGIFGNLCPDTLKALRKLAERALGTDSRSATLLASQWHAIAHFNVLKQVSETLKNAAGMPPTTEASTWVEPPPPPAEMAAFPGPWAAEADNLDGGLWTAFSPFYLTFIYIFVLLPYKIFLFLGT